MKPTGVPATRGALGLAAWALATACLAQATGLPVAPVRKVTDTFFGTAVDDPYRYFENKNDFYCGKWAWRATRPKPSAQSQGGHTTAA